MEFMANVPTRFLTRLDSEWHWVRQNAAPIQNLCYTFTVAVMIPAQSFIAYSEKGDRSAWAIPFMP